MPVPNQMIGLSLSHCVQDIAAGKVRIDDILVIITSTNFNINADDEWNEIWSYYSGTFWSETTEDYARAIVKELHGRGKLHQPRMFTEDHWLSGRGYSEPWLNVVWSESWMQDHPAVKDTWNAYQTALALVK